MEATTENMVETLRRRPGEMAEAQYDVTHHHHQHHRDEALERWVTAEKHVGLLERGKTNQEDE